MKYERQFPFNVPLVLKGFETLYWTEKGQKFTVDAKELSQIYFHEITVQQWYEKFVNNIIDSLGNHYLPIYRMADGEFQFLINNPSSILKGVLSPKKFKRTCWGENYTVWEYLRYRKKYIEQFKEISKNGILAPHFVIEKNKVGYANYIQPILKIFTKNDIVLNDENYYPFYFIYALLSENERFRLFEGERILIVTSYNFEKKKKLELFFKSYFADSVNFYNISPTKAMFEKIEKGKINKHEIDIILVGAGIGAANIINQLNFVPAPCIDAGIMLEVYANPKLKGSRIFVK